MTFGDIDSNCVRACIVCSRAAQFGRVNAHILKSLFTRFKTRTQNHNTAQSLLSMHKSFEHARVSFFLFGVEQWTRTYRPGNVCHFCAFLRSHIPHTQHTRTHTHTATNGRAMRARTFGTRTPGCRKSTACTAASSCGSRRRAIRTRICTISI